MKEIIFHLGLFKTGSSALQMFLASNRQSLLSKSVDYLPIGDFQWESRGLWCAGNGVNLAKGLASGPALTFEEEYLSEFLAAVAKSECQRSVVSSEFFAYANIEGFKKLVARLRDSGIRVKAFYLIREQVQLLSALYIQQVKVRQCILSPADYIAQRRYQEVVWLQYNTFFSGMVSIFGREDLSVEIFDPVNMSLRSVYDTLLAALSIDGAGLNFALGEVNTSLCPQDVAIMMFLNRFGPRRRFSDYVVKNANMIGSANFGTAHGILPSNIANEIAQFFAEENRAFAKVYFNKEELFPIRASSGSVDISLGSLSTRDLVAFFGGLLVNYDQRIAALEAQLETNTANPTT